MAGFDGFGSRRPRRIQRPKLEVVWTGALNSAFMQASRDLWGIDLGGTKIEGAILSAAEPGVPRHRLRLSTDAERGYQHVIGRIAEVVRRLEQASGQARPAVIGIGTPGVTDP